MRSGVAGALLGCESRGLKSGAVTDWLAASRRPDRAGECVPVVGMQQLSSLVGGNPYRRPI